ncbi:Alpha/Beta hydrolase protein [Trichoderma aethiopicum]
MALPRRFTKATQEQTSSFIFLHDKNSSSTALSQHIAHALAPRTLTDTLGPSTNILFLDAPILTFLPNTPPRQQQRRTQEEPQRRTWFSADSSSAAADDDAPSATSWNELSVCMNLLERAVTQESARVGGENVFLVGVGMGFAVAAAYVMSMEERVGGLLGVGGWLAFQGELKRIGVYGEVLGCLGEVDAGCLRVKRRIEDEQEENKEEDEEEDKEDEEEDEEEESAFASGYSTPTLCEEQNDDQAPTSDLMLRRIKAFLEYILQRGHPPPYARTCDRIDSATPVVLVHGADDREISFAHAKEAQETLRHFGFAATLRIVEGETHELSRRLMGELMDGFMSRGLGNGDVRGAAGEMLLGGWL